MDKKVVVHTGLKAGTPTPLECQSLDAPDIDFVLRGPAHTVPEVCAAVADADVALCMHEPYTAEVFAAAPRLRMVLRYGVGYDTIDAKAATEAGVIVGYLPDFCTREVANQAIVLLLNCAKKILLVDHILRTDGWMAARSILSPMGQIHGETLGLLAFGRIGKQTAKRALSMDMKVIAYDPYLEPDVFTSNGVESVGYEELAERSDYVSCHLPLNDETRKMVNARFFSMMKPSAYFINTSRGAVVNEPDLIAALREHKIAGAGLDVFDVEPISPDHPLCKMNNVVLAPHSASWADKTMEMQKIRIGRDALRVARGGMPDFIANPEVLSKLRTWK